MTYSEKLKDPRWQKKRLEILQRDNWACQICGDDENTLHVHHYKYCGEPWEVDSKYLKTLCADCHITEEENLKQYKRQLSDELEGLESECYFSVLCIIHFLKENSNLPIDVSLNILSTCILNDTEFFNNVIQGYYFESIKRKSIKFIQDEK